MKTPSAIQVGSDAKNQGNVSIANSSVLMLTSVLLLHVSIQDGSQRPWVEWADLVVAILLAGLAFYYFRSVRGERGASGPKTRPGDGAFQKDSGTGRSVRFGQVGRSSTTARETLFLLCFAVLPFITDIFLRSFASHGNPLEIQLTLAIRNLMFGLIVLPRSTTGRLAMFTSLFLAIFSALVSSTTTTNVLLAIYALLGLWWLMGDYWARISAHFPDETTTEIPYFARVGAIGLVLSCLAGGAIAFQSSAVTSAVAGFMPSSGGTGGSDPFARGGVGDGEQMVGAKEDADSFGPIESELFLESQQPTIYDMFVENYGEPEIKKRKGRARAIPLTSKETQKQNHKKFGQNKKASREFSAFRRQSKGRRRRKLGDTESKAMLYVAGRTPLHMGLAIYDHWDGTELSLQGETLKPTLRLETDTSNRKWAQWPSPSATDCFAEPERHQLKIINLNSPTIPSPPNLTATHIDKLHDANFFKWENGMLRVRSDKIPSLTVVHVKSSLLHRDRVNSLVLQRGSASAESQIGDRLKGLAEAWTAGANSDWKRIELITEQLRKFELDPEAFPPDDATDAVEHFLFESRQGPDYLFATSAAVLLRSLGYQTRVISGLYAEPDNYDRMAKATGVFAHDMHFWTEVETANGQWVLVDPTPGFEVLYARQTLWQQATATMSGLLEQALSRPMTSVSVVLGIIGVFVFRMRLFAIVATVWWKLRLNASPRQQVLSSVSLLQQLTSKKESGRRTGQTIDQWIETLGKTCDSAAITQFRTLVSWACYASSDRPSVPPDSVRQVCVESVHLLRECA